MKRFLKSITVLSLVLGLFTLNSCKKEEAPDLSTKKVEVGFNVKLNPEISGKKVESTDDYYGGDCTYGSLTDDAYVELKYKLGKNGNEQKANLNFISTHVDEDGFIATDLIQVELDTENSTVDLIVTGFVVYDEVSTESEKAKFEAIMATPHKDSPFRGYVNQGTEEITITIGAYEKIYSPIDVLCFQPDDYLEFGFTWFDFNIVEGEVISVFFNCINSENREGYHEVLPATINAYVGTDLSKLPYLTLDNYKNGVPLSDMKPVNIEVPGLYKTTSSENTIVMTLGVKPFGYNKEILIPVTKAQVDKYKDVSGDWQTNGTVKYNFDTNNDEDLNGVRTDEIEGNEIVYQYDFVKGNATGDDIEKVIHYQFMDCYKPEKVLTNNVDGKCTVYSVYDDDSEVELVKLFEVPDRGFDGHIAITPNKRELVIMNSNNPKILYKYDLFSLEMTTFEHPTGKPEGVDTEYRFSQLVYGKNANGEDQLYAACMANQCLTLIGVDLDDPAKSFSFNADFVLDDNTVNMVWDGDVRGGDLIMKDNGSLFGFSSGGQSAKINLRGKLYDIEFNPNSGHLVSYNNLNSEDNSATVIIENIYDELVDVTGAMVSNNSIITSHENGTFKRWDLERGHDTVGFWPLEFWTSIPQEYKLTNPSTLTIIGNESPTTLSSGDMASIYTLELPK